jgi:DNA-binding transcriptional LysR family regulator
MIDLRHLRYFQTTAELLNFTHAADKLCVTQPTLSESIRELEIELGTELFIRSTRRVSLSWPGEVLLSETRRILRLVDDAVRLTREAAAADAVTLRLGVIDDRDPGVLSRALARCRNLLPGLHATVHVLPTALQLQALQRKQLDLGIVVGPVEATGIAAEHLWSEPLVAVVPRSHPLARRSSVAVAEFREDVFVLPDPAANPGYYNHVLDLCRANGFEPKAGEQSAHFMTRLNQVALGCGAAFVPASCDVTQWPDIAVVPLTDPSASVPVMAVWRVDDGSSALLSVVALLKSSRLPVAADASCASTRARLPRVSLPRNGPRASVQTSDRPPDRPRQGAGGAPSDRPRCDGSH